MSLRVCAVALVLSLPAGPLLANSQDSVRQRAEQACYNNVMQFCNDDVPDEAKIVACMGRNRAKLDPDCRSIYDKGLK